MTLEEHKAALLAYMYSKIELEDWHGVSDAANDMRELCLMQKPLKDS